MAKWWPFKKQTVDSEALFRETEATLRKQFDSALANGTSRQALIHKIETESQQLEQETPTPQIKATLRTYDLLYSELRPRMLGNLSAGKAHEMAGQVDQAITAYEAAMLDEVPTRFPYEHARQVDQAITAYEAAMLDEVPTRFPYEHLRVIYRRQGQFEDALRVCKTAVSNPFLSEKDHAHFQSWVEKFSIQVQ